jgi:hypothetical protein
VISEYRLDNAGQLERPSNAQGVVRHEIGHGVDSALKPYTNNGTVMSMTPEFQDAWKTDIANLSPADLNKLEYFIQNSNPIPERGPDEAFAELFAVLNGGSTNTVGKSYIMRMFPRTTAVVAKSVPTNTP